MEHWNSEQGQTQERTTSRQHVVQLHLLECSWMFLSSAGLVMVSWLIPFPRSVRGYRVTEGSRIECKFPAVTSRQVGYFLEPEAELTALCLFQLPRVNSGCCLGVCPIARTWHR